MSLGSRLAVAAPVALLCLVAAPLTPARAAKSDTFLLSRAADGGLPNAASSHGVISQDFRWARVAAYQSAATNIVKRKTGGHSNIYLVYRATGSWKRLGSRWRRGRTVLASSGMHGEAANGDSYDPALSGGRENAPRCVGFISTASNLVADDTNQKADAFILDLRRHRIKRVSIGAHGQQADGDSYELGVDRDCRRVAFVSDATNLVLRQTQDPSWKSARTGKPPRGSKQVYIRSLGVRAKERNLDRAMRGLTFLASASNGRRAANADATQLSLSNDGHAVFFVSRATNLVSGAGNGVLQVYSRRVGRAWIKRPKGHLLQSLRLSTRLVSAAGGRAGNADSHNPVTDTRGRHVAYETRASNLLPSCARRGTSQIVRTSINGRGLRHNCVSRYRGHVGDGDSFAPTITGAGVFVYFETEAGNLQPLGRQGRWSWPGARDLLLWDARSRLGVRLIENLRSDSSPSETPARSPDTSQLGNYLPFESGDILLDRGFAKRHFPGYSRDPVTALEASLSTPGLQQVYFRYVGPCGNASCARAG